MSRIFLSFIGNHDPGKAEPDADGVLRDGPLPSIIRHLRGVSPVHQAVLFYTPEYEREDGHIQPGTDIEWELTCNRIKEIDATIDIVSVPLKINPALEKDVLSGLLQWLETQPEISGNVIDINIASGTPAMRAVWTFLVDASLLPNASVWNSYNPDALKGKNVAQVERVRKVGLGYLDETRHVYTTAKLMQGMAFAEASDALTSIAREQVTSSRVEKVKLWSQVLDTYTLWDRAFYQEALRKAAEVCANPLYDKLPSSIKATLDNQWVILADVAISRDHAKSLPILLDVYASLSRRFVTRHYPNIATRTRRIIDGCIRYAIGQDTTGPDVAKKNSSSRVMNLSAGIRLVKEEAETHIEKFGPVALINRNQTTGVAPMSFGFSRTELQKIWGIYNGINDHLNESIEVHGFKSPNDNPNGGRVKRMIEASQTCLSVICYGPHGGVIPIPQFLPFGSDTIIDLAEAFRDWV